MVRRITRLRRGAKNMVKQAAHEYALLSHFRVSEMVVGSPLGKKVTRKNMMLSICHGEFRNPLVQKAALYGCQVISVSFYLKLFVCLLVCLAMLVYCAVGYVCTLLSTVAVAADRRAVDDEDMLQLRAREPPRGCSLRLRVLLPPVRPGRGPRRAGGQKYPGTRSQRALGQSPGAVQDMR